MKDKKIIIFLILFSPIISWITLSLIFGKINRKFDELALGKENVIVINKIQNQEFLCSSADNIFNCIEFLRSKDFKRKILWIGNSQLNAVNQGTFNSKIAPYLVSEYFYTKNIGVIVFAAPNISFQEYSEVIKYLLSNIDLDYIIDQLSITLYPDQIQDWLQNPSAHLGGAAPINAFQVNGLAAVLPAISALSTGALA
jgi:hypothetical protein